MRLHGGKRREPVAINCRRSNSSPAEAFSISAARSSFTTWLLPRQERVRLAQEAGILAKSISPVQGPEQRLI